MSRLLSSLATTRFAKPAWLPSWSWLFRQCETAAIAFTAFVGLTLVALAFRFEAWVHEWANFLKHYSAASPEARMPVNLAISLTYLSLFAVICLARRPRRYADGKAS